MAIAPLDDAYITLSNARALIQGGYDPVFRTSALTGATSTLHLAAIALVGAVVPLVEAARLVTAAGVLVYAVGLWRMASGLPAGQRALLAWIGLFAGFLPVQLINGLETGWAMAAVAWAVVEPAWLLPNRVAAGHSRSAKPARAGPSRGTRLRPVNGWIYTALCVIAVLPIVIFDYPPIVDLPAHAARLFIECHRAAFDDMYRIKFGVIPDLAIDGIGSALCGIAPAQPIILWSLALAQLAICGFVWHIRKRLFGANDALVLIAPALAMNLVTIMGYANYLIGIALSFALLFALVRWPNLRPWQLLVVTTIVGCLTFFCHVFALLFMMVVVCGWLWSDRLSGPPLARLVRAGLATAGLFIAPLILMTLISSDEPMSIDLQHKARLIAAPTMTGASSFDIFLVLIWLPAVVLLLATRTLTMARPIRGALLLGVLASLCLPSSLGAAVDIDSRVTVAVAFLLIAGTRLRGEAGSKLVLVLAVITLAIHGLIAVRMWRRFDRQVVEWRGALSVLRPGQGLLSVDAAPGPVPELGGNNDMAPWHLASYATVDRHVFDPQGFTGRGMQPMQVTDRYRLLEAPGRIRMDPDLARMTMVGTPPRLRALLARHRSAAFADWGRRYAYVAFFHYGGADNFDPQRLNVVRRGSFFSILAPKAPVPPIG